MKYLILVAGMLLSTMAQAEKIVGFKNGAECHRTLTDIVLNDTFPGKGIGFGTKGIGYLYKDIVVVFQCNTFFGASDKSIAYVYTKREWSEEQVRHEQDRKDRARREEAERNVRLSVLTR